MTAELVPFTAYPDYGKLAFITVRGGGGVKTLVKVVKINQKNYVGEAEDGLKYTIPIRSFREAPEGTVWTSTVVKPTLTFLDKGTVVRILPTSPYYKYTHGGTDLYVITSQTREQTHNAFPLGGGKRYLPKVTSADVKVVDPKEINLV